MSWTIFKILTNGEYVLTSYPVETHESWWKARKATKKYNARHQVKRDNYYCYYEVIRGSKD